MEKTIEKMLILTPQISKSRLRRTADGAAAGSTLNSQKLCTHVQIDPCEDQRAVQGDGL